MNWFVPFSVQLSSAASMPAGSGTAVTHTENCEDVIHVRAVIRSWFANLLHTENCRWGRDSRSRTVLKVELCHSGQRSWFTVSNHTAKISTVLLTSMQHHVKWFYCTVKVTQVRKRDSQWRKSRMSSSFIERPAEDSNHVCAVIHVRERDSCCSIRSLNYLLSTWITFAPSLTHDLRHWGCNSRSRTLLCHSLTQGRGVLLKLVLCC